jgi:antitoxin MazE
MRSALKKIGNSSGLIIPKPLLLEIGAEAGDAVEIEVEDGRLVVSKVARAVREGWAEASMTLGLQGFSEQDVEWLEAPLTGETDEDWTW